MAIRQRQHPRTPGAAAAAFFGSTFWQAYYVELTILGVVLCILTLRGLEYALARRPARATASALHFPLTFFIGTAFAGLSVGALEAAIVVVAALKILISMAWLITISLQPTMGVAWHRFLAFFNIYLKRHADGRTVAGRAAADRGRRQPGGLREHRGPRRGRRARRRQGRGLHLEGPAGLHHLHRVRPLPVPVPRLEHREAAVAQAAGDGDCATTRTPRRRTCWRPRPTATACPRRPRPWPSCRWSARPATTSPTRWGPTTRTGRTRSSTRTSCGPARRAAPASSSARSTSSTSTRSWTCAATRC